MKKQKKTLIIAGIIVLILVGLFLYSKFYSTGKTIERSSVQITPLEQSHKQKVINIITSSEMITDMPEEDPISLRFFSFHNGKRVWHDGFLIGKDELLSEGDPSIELTLHSKYISEFNNDNLCETIKRANGNKDLGFYSQHNKAKLLWKYKGMLKHRECFGF